MTVGDTSSGAGEEPGADSSVHATPHHEVDHTVEPTDDPLAIRLEALILGADRRYTPFQAARTAGVSMDLASRFWRAMGFADIG
ncbi:adenylate/guanylate cyclase domain-containing protein, partial [Streptomyces sp. SID7982]|nr:adenylate/guanylate cyclase domain-containing protein [Streptomyces sp. SID7982]